MVNDLQNWLTGGMATDSMQFFVLALLVLQGTAILLLGLKLRGSRRVEAMLRRSGEQSRLIAESSPIGICVVSNRRFVYVNQAYVKMFGYAGSEEIVGRFLEELYTPEERERQRRFAKDRAAGKPAPKTYDTKGLRKDGSHFDVLSWVSRIQYDGIMSSLGFVIDRTVEKQLRRQLENTNRLEAIGTLAGGIAHDFNNILTAIIGHTELAMLRAGDNQEVREDLRHVQKAGKRAKDLVQQILTFSRGREGKPQLVCVAAIVREVMGLMRASMPGSIEIRASLENASLIYGDPTQIHQLLMNLFVNAEYAMRGDDGVLEISLGDYTATADLAEPYPDLDPGRYLCLRVADSGHGIPGQIIEKIFEPFFTTKERGEGTGMGLAQVHGIVRGHRGQIRVEENSPRGSRFIIFLPAVSEDATREENAGKAVRGGSESILVVDAEEMVAQVTSQILTHFGYKVQVCRDSLSALELVTDNPDRFDLVLSDVTMPGLTGEKLAKAMLAVRPDLPFILCSGFNVIIDEAEASRLGVRAFLEKPVGKEQLARTIRNVLDEAARMIDNDCLAN